MVGVRLFALVIAGIADASRIQPSTHLYRQQSSENQHNSQRQLTGDSVSRDDPPHRYRKPALANLTDGTKSSSERGNQERHLEDASHHEARDIEGNAVESSKNIRQDALKFRDADAVSIGMSSLLESTYGILQDSRQFPKRFWVLAITVSFLSLIVCFCAFLGKSMLDGSKSKGRSRYMVKGRIVYEWEQTSTTVTLYTKPPEGVQKASLEVAIFPRHIKIGRRGKPPWMKEELFGVVDFAQSTWEISEDGELVVCMYKGETEVLWPCVIRAHHPDKNKRKDKVPIETDLS